MIRSGFRGGKDSGHSASSHVYDCCDACVIRRDTWPSQRDIFLNPSRMYSARQVISDYGCEFLFPLSSPSAILRAISGSVPNASWMPGWIFSNRFFQIIECSSLCLTPPGCTSSLPFSNQCESIFRVPTESLEQGSTPLASLSAAQSEELSEPSVSTPLNGNVSEQGRIT